MKMEIGKGRSKADFAVIAPFVAVLSFLFSTCLDAQTEKQAISFDLLVKNGIIVTMDSERRVLEDGVIAVRGDALVFVGTSSDFALRYVKGVIAKQTIDAKGK